MLSAGAVLALVAVVTVAGLQGQGSSGVTVEGGSRTTLLPAGVAGPPFRAPLVGGGTAALDGVEGPVVLAFWAPWCPACREEMPVVERLSDDYPGLAFRSVVIWRNHRPGPTPEAFIADTGITHPAFLDDGTDALADAYGITGTPTLYLLDAEHRVARTLQGVTPEDELRAAFDALAG
jgi:thiol-disulfide isomerase/thioredoxin